MNTSQSLTQDSFTFLTQGLQHADPVVQADAARLLGELGRTEAVPALITYVRTCRYQFKTAGFEALGRLGSPAAAPEIADLVDNPNTQDDWYWFSHKSVRAAAALTLLRLGHSTEAAQEYLTGLAEKKDDVFYAWFAPAILELPPTLPASRDLQALLSVEALMNSAGLRLTNPNMVVMVLQALGVLATAESTEKLAEFLTWRSRYVRGQAAISLAASAEGRTHLPKVRAQLDTAPTDFERVKFAVALATGGDESGIPQLLEAARSLPDPFDQATALEGLGQLRHPGTLELAHRALEHPHAYVRQCAIEALDRLDAGGDGKSATVVAHCYQMDSSPRVRLQAAKFLAGSPS